MGVLPEWADKIGKLTIKFARLATSVDQHQGEIERLNQEISRLDKMLAEQATKMAVLEATIVPNAENAALKTVSSAMESIGSRITKMEIEGARVRLTAGNGVGQIDAP